jgi:hypothetical protein
LRRNCLLIHVIEWNVEEEEEEEEEEVVRNYWITLRKRGKGKAIPLQAWTGPESSRRLRLQISRQSAHECVKVVSPTHQPP